MCSRRARRGNPRDVNFYSRRIPAEFRESNPGGRSSTAPRRARKETKTEKPQKRGKRRGRAVRGEGGRGSASREVRRKGQRERLAPRDCLVKRRASNSTWFFLRSRESMRAQSRKNVIYERKYACDNFTHNSMCTCNPPSRMHAPLMRDSFKGDDGGARTRARLYVP